MIPFLIIQDRDMVLTLPDEEPKVVDNDIIMMSQTSL